MNNTKPSSSTQKVITGIAVLVVITFLVIGTKAFNNKKTVVATTPVVKTTQRSSTNPSTGSTYKDGTYMATGKYNSPGGTQSVVVSLTIADDTVTDTTAQGQAQEGVAQIYQSDFVGGYKKYVVGKKLTAIKISHVSGSSLTSKGFNSALKQIEQQAKA